jgi:hypothetical protein
MCALLLSPDLAKTEISTDFSGKFKTVRVMILEVLQTDRQTAKLVGEFRKLHVT